MTKILVIEDNEKLNNELLKLLKRYGYEPYDIKRFDNIMGEFKRIKPNLVLIDINLPYFDGFYFCRKIREISAVPIIFITSRNNTSDEILAITIGGDDYITKPFDNQVLLIRIAAILKRYFDTSGLPEIVTDGKLQLDVSSNIIINEDKKVELTKNEQKLLLMLMRNKSTVVHRVKLMEMLWDNDEFVDENTLSVNINRLRGKLEQIDVPNYISTVRGQGYIIK